MDRTAYQIRVIDELKVLTFSQLLRKFTLRLNIQKVKDLDSWSKSFLEVDWKLIMPKFLFYYWCVDELVLEWRLFHSSVIFPLRLFSVFSNLPDTLSCACSLSIITSWLQSSCHSLSQLSQLSLCESHSCCQLLQLAELLFFLKASIPPFP